MTKESTLNDEFVDEFQEFLEARGMKGIICLNCDDKEMGYSQGYKKIGDKETGFYLVIGFSGKGNTLCPHCAANKEHTHES